MYDFWGDGYFPDVMTLHAGGNDTSGKLKNRLAAELCREKPFATHQYVLCQVFLNGEYWGLYDLAEGYTAHYIAYTYGVPEQAVVSMKNTLLEAGDGETLEALRQEQASAMAAHYRRWYSITPEAFFDETEEYLAFFENRPRVIRQLLWQYDLLPKDTAP